MAERHEERAMGRTKDLFFDESYQASLLSIARQHDGSAQLQCKNSRETWLFDTLAEAEDYRLELAKDRAASGWIAETATGPADQ